MGCCLMVCRRYVVLAGPKGRSGPWWPVTGVVSFRRALRVELLWFETYGRVARFTVRRVK